MLSRRVAVIRRMRTALAGFLVEGEQHYWVHVAIVYNLDLLFDHLAGKPIESEAPSFRDSLLFVSAHLVRHALSPPSS